MNIDIFISTMQKMVLITQVLEGKKDFLQPVRNTSIMELLGFPSYSVLSLSYFFLNSISLDFPVDSFFRVGAI